MRDAKTITMDNKVWDDLAKLDEEDNRSVSNLIETIAKLYITHQKRKHQPPRWPDGKSE